ncbi:hypothetical protein OQA88_3133 [Cercophora sp. LCS_1]
MPDSQYQAPEEVLLGQLSSTLAGYESSQPFSCSGSFRLSPTSNDSRVTSDRESETCMRPIIFWCTRAEMKSAAFDSTWAITRGWENNLEELAKDCILASLGCDGQNGQTVGVLSPSSFFTNFKPEDCGILDAIARELSPGIARSGKESTVKKWGIVAELHELKVYSRSSGMSKISVDTPLGRTHFGSLVVVLPTKYEGGQLKVTHKGREQVHLGNGGSLDATKWVAFYNDCEHQVLPVSSGHCVTLIYHLYVSAHMDSLLQPRLQASSSKGNGLSHSVKDLLASPSFMPNGGILGFHCSFKYPEKSESTYYYEHYSLALKGIDAVVFTVFRSFGLIVHIKSYGNDRGTQIQDVRRRCRASGWEPPLCKKDFERLSQDCYVGNEIFGKATWLNDTPQESPAAQEQLVDAELARWLGNEAEAEWDYCFWALFAMVPAFADRVLDNSGG